MLKVKWVLGIMAIMALLIGSSAPFLVSTGPAVAETGNPYLVKTFTDDEGNEIDVISVPGSPPDFRMAAVEVPEPNPQMGVNILSNVPAFDWCYGCSATSAAMLFGYYDRIGYGNMYAGTTNGGICPLDNTSWGQTAYPDTCGYGAVTCGECPLSATHQGYDGLATKGHVDDYWIAYGCTGDPYSGNWTEHTQGDCTGDYMGTSQWKYSGIYGNFNHDGETLFFNNTNGSALYDYTGDEPNYRDGCHGMRLFAESRGYTVTTNYNQYIYGYQGNTLGFTFAQFKAEIDAGRPVLIQLQGHSMLGYGYDDTSGNIIYIHDTWDHLSHTMTWGGSYGGMTHYAVTVFQLAPVGTNPPTFETDQVNANHNWQTVNLTASFTDPVVVAKPMSHNGGDPGVVRIRNVTATSFEIRIQEWDYLDGYHTTEQVSWLAMERGHWTLSGGAEVEAGTINTSSCGLGPFAHVNFSSAFTSTPVVTSSIMTYNETDAVATRNTGITTTGFYVTMQEQQLNTQSHATETISYIAWEPSTGTEGSINYEVAIGGSVNHGFTTVSYGPFASTPYFLADMQTISGGDPCSLRYYNKTTSSVQVKVDEEQSGDSEKAHPYESVGYFAFSSPSVAVVLEVGQASVNHNWQTVNLTASFTDPVVVAKPMSHNGGDPGVVRIRNVTATSFEIRIQEWDYLDGYHTTEQVSWLAMERGHWTLSGGAEVEAGTIDTSSCGLSPFAHVNFSSTFTSTPVVTSSIMTYNETDAVATRNTGITTTGFYVTMQEQQLNTQSHATETISYIAWEPSTGTEGSINYEVAIGGSVNHGFTTVSYGPFASTPYFLADMQTISGGDPCSLRYYNKTTSSVQVKVDEEQSGDSEKAHPYESVGYFAFS